jgi:hypothetical protein
VIVRTSLDNAADVTVGRPGGPEAIVKETMEDERDPPSFDAVTETPKLP